MTDGANDREALAEDLPQMPAGTASPAPGAGLVPLRHPEGEVLAAMQAHGSAVLKCVPVGGSSMRGGT